MGVLVAGGLTGLLNQSSAQIIDGSLKFDSGSQTTLTRTNSSSGNRKTWTLSFWTKRLFDSGNYQSYLMGKTDVTEGFNLRINDPTDQKFYLATVSGSGLTSDAVFRDFSAWMHVVIVYNSTDSTSTDRVRLYVNGERQTFGSGSYPSLNLDGEFNNSGDFGIGYHNGNTALDAYLSEYHFIDGQALDSSYFGYTDPLTNTWRPKKYTGTFTGTNTFYLPMDGNSPIGQDKSGNGNNWTAVNFSGTSNDPDVLKDSPSGAVSGGRAQTGITTTSSAPSNYATMNPLQRSLNRTPTLSDGNLTVSLSSGTSEWTNTGCTMNIGSGKYYWEVQFTTINGTIARIGVADSNNYEFNRNTASSGLPWLGSGTGVSWSLDVGGNTYYNGSTVNASYTSTIITSDIIGVLLDLDNNTLSYSKNGTNLGVAHSNVTSDFVTPGFGLHGATTNTINVNFGQKPFKYAPPQGFLPLNSASATPETVITRPEQYVGLATYTGNGGTQSINVGLKPDLVWIKRRNVATSHMLYDQIRGSGTTAELIPNATYAQGSVADVNAAQYGYLSGYTSNGFSVQAGSSNGVYTNENSSTYVAWTWRAGGSKNTFNKDDVGYASAAAAGLTAGANANLVTGSSVGTKQGFSIIKFNASAQSSAAVQLPHGLSQSPSFLIVKALDSNGTAWYTWHKDLSNTAQNRLFLNGDNAQDGNTSIWNNTAPSSTTFSVGGDPHNNDNCITYLWHDVPGLQKFGKYDGNNDANGPFIELGFRPTLFVMKQLTGTGYWMVYDSARDPVNNGSPYYLFWNTNAAHGTGYDLDFLSNGVKLRTDNANFNASTPYVYMAWAEAPTFNLYGAQSNAR